MKSNQELLVVFTAPCANLSRKLRITCAVGESIAIVPVIFCFHQNGTERKHHLVERNTPLFLPARIFPDRPAKRVQ